MPIKNLFKFVLLLLIIPFGLSSQKLVYKLKSKIVERSWKLSSKAYAQETYMSNATIELFEGTKLVTKTTSDSEGNFGFDLPSIGNFTMVISKAGYNTRKFSLNCNSIVVKNNEANFIPSVDITGFMSYKAIKNVGDIGLSTTKVQMADEKNQELKYGGLNFPVIMNDGDIRVIQKFCTCNKLGDIAYQNKNYASARNYYLMALSIMKDEEYPAEQLKRAEEGLKQAMLEEKANMSSKAKARTVAPKKATTQPASVNTSVKTSQKSGSGGGHKVLPVLGGKK